MHLFGRSLKFYLLSSTFFVLKEVSCQAPSFGPPGPNVVLCPNNGQPKRNFDGDLLSCLPNFVFCPSDSACLFNGLNFLCCPMMEPQFLPPGPMDSQFDNGAFGQQVQNNFGDFNNGAAFGRTGVDSRRGLLFQPLHSPPSSRHLPLVQTPLPLLPAGPPPDQRPFLQPADNSQMVQTNLLNVDRVQPDLTSGRPFMTSTTTRKPTVTTPQVTTTTTTLPPLTSTLSTTTSTSPTTLPPLTSTLSTTTSTRPTTLQQLTSTTTAPIIVQSNVATKRSGSHITVVENPVSQTPLPLQPLLPPQTFFQPPPVPVPLPLPPQQINFQQPRLLKMAKYNYVLDGYPYEEVVLLPAPMPQIDFN